MGPIRSFYNGKKQSMRGCFFHAVKRQHKNTDGIRASQCGGLPGKREGKTRSLYTGIFDFFLTKLHSGRNYRDIHDRWEIEFFHGKRPHFSLHTFILHKPLLFTTSPQKIFYSASPSFRSERSGEIILQNGASSWLLKLLNCKRIMMAAPFYRRGAFLYKTNAERKNHGDLL